jgi:hypothetical protein
MWTRRRIVLLLGAMHELHELLAEFMRQRLLLLLNVLLRHAQLGKRPSLLLHWERPRAPDLVRRRRRFVMHQVDHVGKTGRVRVPSSLVEAATR